MSVDRPLSALNLYDVLTDLIPGIAFVGSIVFLVRIEDIEALDLAVLIAFIAVGGYVAGHVLQSARSWIWGTPDLFQRTASTLYDGADETELGEISPIESEFLNRCRERFDLDDEFDDWTQLFRLVMSYLETQPERRALRFQALHSFYWSMAAAFGGIAVLAVAAAGAVVIAEVELLRSIEVLLVVLGVSTALLLVFEFRRRKFQHHFIQYLITDFYVATTRDN